MAGAAAVDTEDYKLAPNHCEIQCGCVHSGTGPAGEERAQGSAKDRVPGPVVLHTADCSELQSTRNRLEDITIRGVWVPSTVPLGPSPLAGAISALGAPLVGMAAERWFGFTGTTGGEGGCESSNIKKGKMPR